MAGQPPGPGKTQCYKISRLLFGGFSLTNCEVKQFSAPEDRRESQWGSTQPGRTAEWPSFPMQNNGHTGAWGNFFPRHCH